MIDKEKALEYVKEYLLKTGKESEESKRDSGYWRPDAKGRFEHIKRVHQYAKILCNFVENVNPEVVELAAIFHDAGKFVSYENHAQLGSDIAREYLAKEGADSKLIDKVCNSIEKHSTKPMSQEQISKLTIDDKVLIDADVIDEKGVMSVLWIAMQEGREELSYERTIGRLNKNLEVIHESARHAHTQLAREILLKKYMLVKGIIHTLEREMEGDLF